MSSAPPFPNIVISHLEGRAKPIHYRQAQLRRLQEYLIKSKDEVKDAIRADSGYTAFETDLEYTLILSELRQHYKGLDTKHENHAIRQIELGHENAQGRRNTSIAYIVPGTPISLYAVLSPVCAAIAAGSCVVVELPQTLQSLTSTLRRLLFDSLDSDTFAISESRPTDSDFLQNCTLVLQSQPDKLSTAQRTCISPSSLQTLAVVDRTASIDEAAQAVIRARFSRTGTSSYAPDAVLVNEFILEKFMTRLLHYMSPFMAQENGGIRGDSLKPKLRKQHTDRQNRILETAAKSKDMRIVVRGSNGSIISAQDRTNPLLTQKINCPILLVHSISSLDDAISFANQSPIPFPNPLAATFIFATPGEANYLATFIDAHISCVNHIPAELLVGPPCPIEYPPSPTPRYTRAMFESPVRNSCTKLS